MADKNPLWHDTLLLAGGAIGAGILVVFSFFIVQCTMATAMNSKQLRSNFTYLPLAV